MPTWSGILAELNTSKITTGKPQFDQIRRKYLDAVQKHTDRDTILYATAWTIAGKLVPPEFLSINDEDLQGIMEVIHGLKGPNLDLIIHSPGGHAEAAEAIVSYLRSKFSNIRVIIPQMAMSAASMIACSADVIVMGKHSFMGPIDPQLIMQTHMGPQMVPAQAILEQFELAKKECQDPQKMAAWLPMLGQYGPHLLIECKNLSCMSENLVRSWLEIYMFNGDAQGKTKADKIAKWLSSHSYFKSHGRHIPREEIERQGLIIEHLEKDQNAQDLFLSVFHATTHTFAGTAASKIIENHLGKAFIKQLQPLQIINKPQQITPPTPAKT